MTRTSLAADLAAALEPKDWALALGECGSAAFGRADDLSDLDLVLTVEDGRLEDAIACVESVMEAQGGFSQKYELPQPAWHGAWQAFYRPASDNPFFMLDICIVEQSKPWTFTERTRHGVPNIFFDRIGALTPTEMTEKEIADYARPKFEQHAAVIEMFHDFPEKELRRGNNVDAFAYYHSLILTRVVALLRIRHCPDRHDFGFRYLKHDLPLEVAEEIENLLFVQGADDLRVKVARALELGRQAIAEVRESGVLQSV